VPADHSSSSLVSFDLSASRRNNVQIRGKGGRDVVFAHGYGCDQNMWRFVAPAFEQNFRTILFDHVGAGGSDFSVFDSEKYGSLAGYASDLVELARELELRDAVFVGHSVSAMIGALASIEALELFSDLVMIGPSPRYIDDEEYVGGFAAAQIEELLDFLDENPMAWSQTMAPTIMGNPDRPELGQELTESFCRMHPDVAKLFARVTFLSDNRSDLPKVQARALVLQCSEDVIAPLEVGHYVHRHISNSELVVLKATGHCPNLSAPDEVIAAIHAFV
jgi:sigma-B regulation protein RsbQ